MEKKSHKEGNDSGIVAVVFGILSIVFALMVPFLGIVLGIISLVFSVHQKKNNSNSWAKAGITLSVIGIVLSILIWILLTTVLAPYLSRIN